MFKLLLIPEPIQFPVALLNTSIYSVRSHLRLRVFSLKAARSLLGTHEPCDPREESLSITRDLIRASEPSASLIKLVSVLPKDSVNFFWCVWEFPSLGDPLFPFSQESCGSTFTGDSNVYNYLPQVLPTTVGLCIQHFVSCHSRPAGRSKVT